jgi:propanol-preferring alcohol dehydrogenase
MRAVFLPGNRRVELREVDPRRPGAGEVLIAARASCICRGDVRLCHGKAVTPGSCVSGHEPAGVVEEVGPGVGALRAGDRVAVHLGIGNIDLGRLATHTFSLDEAETAFRMFDQRETGKAVFVI